MAGNIERLAGQLEGYELPGGKFRLEPYEAWLGEEAMQSQGGSASLNITWVLIAGLKGMGISIADLVALAGAKVEDGVLFGEVGLEQQVPLVVETHYSVSGRILGITRHQGKRAGVFDILSFEVDIQGPDGRLHAQLTCSFILTRESQ
jgi:hypothetical protein